jgi:hypothetical protein
VNEGVEETNVNFRVHTFMSKKRIKN